MIKANSTIPFPWVTMIIVTLMGSIYAAFGAVPDPLVFDQQLVLEDSFWQLLTAHLVHSDINHLIWNGTAAFILGCLLERHIGWKLLPITLGGMLAVDMFLLQSASLSFYCGFSGVLNTWLAALLVIEGKNPRVRPYMLLTAIAVLTKIAVEWNSNTALFTNTAWPSVPAAHLSGWIGGLVIVAAIQIAGKIADFVRALRPWIAYRSESFFCHHVS